MIIYFCGINVLLVIRNEISSVISYFAVTILFFYEYTARKRIISCLKKIEVYFYLVLTKY